MGNIRVYEIGLIAIRAVLLGTEFSDNDRRTGDNKTRPKTSAGSSHGKSVQVPIRFVILHSVYDSLDRFATASEQSG